jgi:hypothetical protein
MAKKLDDYEVGKEVQDNKRVAKSLRRSSKLTLAERLENNAELIELQQARIEELEG